MQGYAACHMRVQATDMSWSARQQCHTSCQHLSSQSGVISTLPFTGLPSIPYLQQWNSPLLPPPGWVCTVLAITILKKCAPNVVKVVRAVVMGCGCRTAFATYYNTQQTSCRPTEVRFELTLKGDLHFSAQQGAWSTGCVNTHAHRQIT